MEVRYRVNGLHCPSCEILIEEKLIEQKDVKSVDVDLTKNEIKISSKRVITPQELDKLFKKDGYSFSEIEKKTKEKKEKNWWLPAVAIILFFLILGKFGLAKFLNINDQSSLLTFFVFGIVAGFSSCGALMSGIILAYPKKTGRIILGRIVGYTILGAILGYLGQNIIKAGLVSALLLIVSAIMVITGLQMLGIEWAKKIRLALPKQISKKILSEKMPLLVGLLTVFLPCGFTLMAEGAATINSYWLGGMMIMLAFVLGTSIPLFLIGWSNERLWQNQKTIGLLILFFALYNLNFQFGIINKFWPKTEIANKTVTEQEKVRVIKASYSRFGGLSPNPIEVKKGENIRLEIEVKDNEFGCMSTILLPELYNKPQTLTAGKKLIMEFRATEIGNYQFTCAMGVPHKGLVKISD